MKAVNLLPAELRAARSGGGQTGGMVYVVLGVLAVFVVMASTYAFMGKQIADRKAEVVQLEAEAVQVEGRAGALAKYEKAAAAARKRVQEVRTVADARIEWSHTLREVSRVLPEEAWLTSIRATATPTVGVEGGAPNPLRSATPDPAVEVVGCTSKQDSVARLMSRLRGMDRVTRVALSSSAKAEGGAGATGASSSGCANDAPQFNLVVFFNGPAGPAAPAAGAAPAATPTPTPGAAK
jgi:Tfp pilus assembly protein PilN